MKAIFGLGNPGAEYDATRHNVGWWFLDRLVHDWGFPTWRREGPALTSRGHREGEAILLVKPTTYMNRSGAALRLLAAESGFLPERDLLVVVDDVALRPGKVRFRPSGSAGGHNGLRSIEGALGTTEYPRLRIGVGGNPPGTDRVEWVLGEMDAEEEEAVLARFPHLVEGVEAWLTEGIQETMSRFNG